MQKCFFLGTKNQMVYCRKGSDRACPSGYIGTCPCIPADFWNVAKSSDSDKIPTARQVENVEPHMENPDSLRPKLKMPIKNISIFKNS